MLLNEELVRNTARGCKDVGSCLVFIAFKQIVVVKKVTRQEHKLGRYGALGSSRNRLNLFISIDIAGSVITTIQA